MIVSKLVRRSVLGLIVLVAAGCASTTISPQGGQIGRLAKPDRILVYPIVANSAELDAETAARSGASAAKASAEELEVGRRLGASIAENLVKDIRGMGLNAEVGSAAASPRVGDIVIRGYFTSIDEGSTAKRLIIGFGSGKAEIRTVVEGYVMTEQGLRRVGGATVDSAGGKTPGVVVPILVTAATANPIGLVVGGAVKVGQEVSGSSTVDGAARRTTDQISERLRARFEEQGWI